MKVERELGSGTEFVYAYYFPSQIRPDSFPHKIGRAKRDPFSRVKEQQASMQEEPVIGTLVRCSDSRMLEAQIHLYLKHRQLPTFGREWFDIHPDAIQNCLEDGLAELDWGNQLHCLRIKAGLSQTELAKCADLRQGTVSRMESSAPCTRISTILEICRELKVRMTFVPIE